MAPLNWCERCGTYFTAGGQDVKKAATARGPVFDIPDDVCPRCIKPGEARDIDGKVVPIESIPTG